MKLNYVTVEALLKISNRGNHSYCIGNSSVDINYIYLGKSYLKTHPVNHWIGVL